ncbi:MAG: 2-amino-4-hydroxy-6-hydroxymethyldihydropteridine diphosphokinase [Chlorobiaceae bacterium]|nr:2-amino-4-hydroxy-6-hydroxymethyldihydropteridine diphosphokinase [Chlorobiaceae bacterium]
MTQHKAFIGIGSNIGDRLHHLQEAVNRLALLEETALLSLSSVYMTEPVGEAGQNRFYNGVVLVETALEPEELRRQCKIIELELGRPLDYPRWSPRVIDLDILLYDDRIITTPTLTIPHPELHCRKFVLLPMLDITNPLHPSSGESALQLLEQCSDPSVLIKIKERLLP